MLIGYTPEEQDGTNLYKKDESGNILKDASGRPIVINREAALREALMQARNSTTLALRGGSKVQEVGANGSGIPFYKALEVLILR